MTFARFLITLCYIFSLSISGGANPMISYDYCVIGAGPGGLQIGQLLQSTNRDYMIFEKEATPGSFFKLYPRHRNLISINKCNTGRTNKEFNLRHDWNSLISDNDDLLFTKYTKEYFPHADRMVDYLNDYQKELKLKVQFNRTISQIKMENKPNCKLSFKDQMNRQYCCRLSIVVANGISVPRVTVGFGHELVEGYESMNIDPKNYTNQNILIYGKGNSGLEVANSLYGEAAVVHIVSSGRTTFSWDTHYVGDVRAVNNEVLDAYQLKSLDGVLDETDLRTSMFYRRPDGKIDLYIDDYMDNDPMRRGYDRVLRCTGFKWDSTLFDRSTRPEVIKERFPLADYNYESKQFPGMYFAGILGHSLDYRKSAGGFVHGFRYTARATHRLMEWANHNVPWPSKNVPLNQLTSALLKNVNEQSGIYQMFTHFGDIAIYDKKTKMVTYMEEVPMHLWTRMSTMLGHEFRSGDHLMFTLTLEYGKNWSIAGEDHFFIGRGQSDVKNAHRSLTLHPLVRVFDTVPEYRPEHAANDTHVNTQPLGILHILGDFVTEYSSLLVDIDPLRKFIDFFTETDLENHSPEQCLVDFVTEKLDSTNDACMRAVNNELSDALF